MLRSSLMLRWQRGFPSYRHSSGPCAVDASDRNEEPHANSNGRRDGKRFRRWVRCGLMVILPFILFVYVLIWNFAGLFDPRRAEHGCTNSRAAFTDLAI